jgi:hypothetical protein
VCRELEFEIVRNWSTGHSEYWGKLGHFAIGWKACDYVTGGLKTLMGLNQERIGFGDETLGLGAQFTMGRGDFVPLADVSDYVWVHAKGRGFEGIQHFADIDIHDIDGGESMLNAAMTMARIVRRRSGRPTSTVSRRPESARTMARCRFAYGRYGRRWSPT